MMEMPKLLPLVGVVNVNRLPLQADGAAVHGIDAGENLHERGLAGAVFADQPQYFAAPDLQAHIAERLDTGKRLGDMLHPQQNTVVHD